MMLAPTVEKAVLFSFFLIVLAFTFVESCTATGYALAGSCNAQFYPVYIGAFSVASYGAACALMFACKAFYDPRRSAQIRKR